MPGLVRCFNVCTVLAMRSPRVTKKADCPAFYLFCGVVMPGHCQFSLSLGGTGEL